MDVRTKDGRYTINISYDIWHSLYSTVVGRLGSQNKEISEGILFLKDIKCQWNEGLRIARQINLIRDRLSQVKPEDAIYDIDDINKEAPWKGKISPVITSCANMYTTNDGKDLLYEIVSMLCYAEYSRNNIE